MSSTSVGLTALPARSKSNNSAKPDLWEEALNTLSAEDRKQYAHSIYDPLEVLKKVQEATETKKEMCIVKGWRIYRNKNNEDVKLRHVLERISVWVQGVTKVIDLGVSLDQSGHAALPWGVVKFLLLAGFSDVDQFSNVAEGVESISGLIARYTIVEKLYLHGNTEATAGLQESIRKLYAAILAYLAKIKSYFEGNRLKRVGRSLLDVLSKRFDELKTKVTETEVEKWIALVDSELHQKTIAAESEQFESLKQALLQLEKPIIQMSNPILAMHDNFTKEERRKIFRWISEIEYTGHHHDFSKDLLPDSGRWLFESRPFIEWGQTSISSILWLHGIPGSGKTRLVSTVINFMSQQSHSATSSAFFYCARSTAEPERGKPVEVLSAILRQLAGSKSDLPIRSPVAEEYKARKEEADEDGSKIKKLSLEDCTRLILELTQDSPATIVIDALDECEERTRHELLEALNSIIRNSGEIVKVLVSSRDDIDIKLRLEGSKNISISANHNSGDIKRFVQSEVRRLSTKGLLLDGRISKPLREKIIETLTTQAQGMFRWVAMSLEYLQQIKFEPDFKQALGQLPTKLSDLYDSIHLQIETSGTHGRDVATKTLKWLLCAQRLLSIEELVAAVPLVYEDGVGPDPDWEEDTAESSSDSAEDNGSSAERIPSPENDIIRLCRNFVVIDFEQGVFRFAHQSVREYLLTRKREEYSHLEQHAYVVKRCLDVYLTEVWPSGQPSKSLEIQNNVLKKYARIYWPIHYKYIHDIEDIETFVPQVLREKMSKFLRDGSSTSQAYIQWAREIRRKDRAIGDYVPDDDYLRFKDSVSQAARGLGDSSTNQDLLHWANYMPSLLEDEHSDASLEDHFEAMFGIEPWTPLGQGLLFASTKPETYLGAISAFGFHSLIIHHEFSPADCDQISICRLSKYNLLAMASYRGHTRVVQVLLDSGADVNAQCGHNHDAISALHGASSSGHVSIVEILLKRGADVNLPHGDYRTPLYMASEEGYDRVVQLLLDNGAYIYCHANAWSSPLYAASSRGHYKVVQTLLHHGANVNEGAESGNIPLHAAAQEGHDKVVQILLHNGANVNDQKYGNTPLYLASFEGHDQVVQMLLDNGADVNVHVEGGTALHAASYQGHDSIVRMLLEHGIYIDVMGTTKIFGSLTALCTASGHDRYQVVQTLLEKGANVNAKASILGSALHWASAKGYDKIVQLLLENGANVNGAGGIYGSLLQAASRGGHRSIVKLLLANGAEVDAEGGEYGFALQAASRGGHRSIVELLLANGAEVDAKGGKYGFALQAASRGGHPSIVRLLLANGAEVDAEGGEYGSALKAALAKYRHKTVEILIAHGADVNAGSEECTDWQHPLQSQEDEYSSAGYSEWYNRFGDVYFLEESESDSESMIKDDE